MAVTLVVEEMVMMVFMAGGRVVIHARCLGTVRVKSCRYSHPQIQELHELPHSPLLVVNSVRSVYCSLSLSLLFGERERETERGRDYEVLEDYAAVGSQKNWKKYALEGEESRVI